MPKAKSKTKGAQARTTRSATGQAREQDVPQVPLVPPVPSMANAMLDFSLDNNTFLDAMCERVLGRMQQHHLHNLPGAHSSQPGPQPPPTLHAFPPQGQPSTSAVPDPLLPSFGHGISSPANAADAAISSILGESRPGSHNATRISAPLGLHVPSKMKCKIWEGKFIDLRQLLPDNSVSSDDESTSKPKDATKSPLSIHDFVEAFHIFISIRAERFPTDAPGMLKHLSTIQKMDKLFGDVAWQHYDLNFRKAIQYNPTLNWSHLDLELYTESSLMGISAQKQAPPSITRIPLRQRESFRPNTCWTFQARGRCDNPKCRFMSSHNCYKCKGRHATSQCRSSNPSSFTKRQPAGRNSNPNKGKQA